MPGVTAATVARLTWAVEAAPDVDAAVLVDQDGRRQTLAGVYRYAALVAARPDSPEEWHGLPVKKLVGSLRFTEVAAVGAEARDVDTWEDLRSLGE
jgi:CTP:molybdopterin cytidylyltransferase MocA